MLTFREYITQVGKRFYMTDADIDLLLLNQATIIPDDEAQVDVKIAKRAMVNEFATILPLTNISQGGFNVSWNVDAAKEWYNLTCAELGISSQFKARIKNRSNVW